MRWNGTNWDEALQKHLRSKVVYTLSKSRSRPAHHAKSGANLGAGPHGTLMADVSRSCGVLRVSRSCSVLLTFLNGVRW